METSGSCSSKYTDSKKRKNNKNLANKKFTYFESRKFSCCTSTFPKMKKI